MSETMNDVIRQVWETDPELVDIVEASIRTVMWSDWETNGEAPEMAECLKMFEEAYDDLTRALKVYKKKREGKMKQREGKK